jgi:hypothetical protein
MEGSYYNVSPGIKLKLRRRRREEEEEASGLWVKVSILKKEYARKHTHRYGIREH